MLALDRGGSSVGMLFRFPAATARAELRLPWRREMFTGAYLARWVRVASTGGAGAGDSFVANRAHPRYAGRLDEATIAARLAVAGGSLGTCAEYLAHTLAVLRAHGRTDHRLERLERMVLERGSAKPPPPLAGGGGGRRGPASGSRRRGARCYGHPWRPVRSRGWPDQVRP